MAGMARGEAVPIERGRGGGGGLVEMKQKLAVQRAARQGKMGLPGQATAADVQLGEQAMMQQQHVAGGVSEDDTAFPAQYARQRRPTQPQIMPVVGAMRAATPPPIPAASLDGEGLSKFSSTDEMRETTLLLRELLKEAQVGVQQGNEKRSKTTKTKPSEKPKRRARSRTEDGGNVNNPATTTNKDPGTPRRRRGKSVKGHKKTKSGSSILEVSFSERPDEAVMIQRPPTPTQAPPISTTISLIPRDPIDPTQTPTTPRKKKTISATNQHSLPDKHRAVEWVAKVNMDIATTQPTFHQTDSQIIPSIPAGGYHRRRKRRTDYEEKILVERFRASVMVMEEEEKGTMPVRHPVGFSVDVGVVGGVEVQCDEVEKVDCGESAFDFRYLEVEAELDELRMRQDRSEEDMMREKERAEAAEEALRKVEERLSTVAELAKIDRDVQNLTETAIEPLFIEATRKLMKDNEDIRTRIDLIEQQKQPSDVRYEPPPPLLPPPIEPYQPPAFSPSPLPPAPLRIPLSPQHITPHPTPYQMLTSLLHKDSPRTSPTKQNVKNGEGEVGNALLTQPDRGNTSSITEKWRERAMKW